MQGMVVGEAVALLRACVDCLLSDNLTGLAGVDVVNLLREVEVQRRRLEVVDQRLLAEAEERALSGELGRCSTRELLVSELRVAPGEARRRVARALYMGPRRALSGEALPPIFPLVAQAQSDGAISSAHADTITECITAISPRTAADAGSVAESFLVEAARHENPTRLRQSAAALLARLEPDGLEPQEERTERRRDFALHSRSDGSFAPSGTLTGETGAVWQTILAALSAPAPADDGTADERSPGQRRHDALREAGLRLLRSGRLPDCGGVPVTVLARTTLAELQTLADATARTELATPTELPTLTDRRATPGSVARGRSGIAVTEHGDLLSVQALLRLASEAEIVPVVLDDLGGVVAYGRTRRLATPGQRRALAARDGGCCFPGCDRPPSWSEVHHIVEWLIGGPTDLDNLCLLRSHHHREFERLGWLVEMCHGLPQWIPPPWIDAERRPRRNTVHHLHDITFTGADAVANGTG